MNANHTIRMLAICLTIIVAIVFLASMSGVTAGAAVLLGLLLLCPLVHIPMMKSMIQNSEHDEH